MNSMGMPTYCSKPLQRAYYEAQQRNAKERKRLDALRAKDPQAWAEQQTSSWSHYWLANRQIDVLMEHIQIFCEMYPEPVREFLALCFPPPEPEDADDDPA